MLLSLAGAALLAAVHLFAGKLRFLDVIPRSRWLSFGGGISVAYVFLHLLPELGEARQPLAAAMPGGAGFIEHHGHALALIGLAVFYGLERMAEESRERRRRVAGEDDTSEGVFWLHILSFAVYSALIGYVLGERSGEVLYFGLFLFAMAVHFVVNDYGLRQHHKEAYQRVGRWVLSAAVLIGAWVGVNWKVEDIVLVVPTALITGGVVLNVLKEELPQERRSRFWAFALGLTAYGAVLMSL